ncbi:MAG: site-2 protease family protein [Clostridia bacterium]|nr:site-2 protease family protein [Clostridia bacterium]
MSTILTVLVAVLVFGFLIFTHELGHFLAARAFGVKVYEFSIGMGPKLAWYDSKKSGIRYKLCMFPFGGYVSMAEEGKDDAALSEDPQALSNQKPWKRFIIMAAGGVVNLIIGVVLMFAVVVSSQLGSTVVAGFPEEIRNEEVFTGDYGLQSGDTVVSIGGKRVHTSMELDYEILRNGIEPLEVVVLRDGEYVTLNVTFPTSVTTGQIVGERDFSLYEESKSFSSVIKHTFWRSVCTVRMVWESLFDLVTGRFGVEAVSGPIGITSTVGEAVSYGFVPLLYMVSIISINLGIVNLFPLPALDGGRLVFVLIEMIRRKPVPRELEAKIHGIGMILLLLLAVLIMFKDIRTIFFASK